MWSGHQSGRAAMGAEYIFNMCFRYKSTFPPNTASKCCLYIYIMLWNIQVEISSNALSNTLLTKLPKLQADRIFGVDHKLKCLRNLLSTGPPVIKRLFGGCMPPSNRWLFNGIYIHSNRISLVKGSATCGHGNGAGGRIKCWWKQGSGSIKS